MIGLVDYDFQTSIAPTLIPPNLEIMKLATYYKVEKNIFCRLVSLNETELTNYDKIYFFSEQTIAPEIPDAFKRANNIIFGGTTFTNGIYQPFEDEIIDYTLPRPFIYKEILKQKYNDGVKSTIINHILDDSYYRCYAGQNKLPIPPIKARKRFFLYDIDFFYKDWELTLQDIANRKPSSIIRIHPVICKTLQQYFSVRKFFKFSRQSNVILDLNIPIKEVDYMLKKYKNQFLEDISESSNVYISLGGNFKTSFQYYKDFIYKVNILYAFWSRGIPLKIYYIYPHIGINDNLKPISILTSSWSKLTKTEKTLRQRIFLKSKKDTPEQQAYNQLIKFHPEAKDLFDQTYKQLVERGYWRL